MHAAGVPIPFETSAFIILGTNIGTSTTAMIASIPANRESKRAALFHISYDVFGCIVFGSLIIIFPQILGWFQSTWYETARQVAWFHMLYNIATMLCLLPFVKIAARLMKKIIPDKNYETEGVYEKKLLHADAKYAPTPAIAVFNAHSNICRMGKIANANLRLSLDAFFDKDMQKTKKVFENEDVINYLNQAIAGQLVTVSGMRVSKADAEKIGKMFRILSDIERIGDHAENIAEFAVQIENDGLKLSQEAYDELRTLGDTAMELTDLALEAYETDKRVLLGRVKELEETVDKLSADFTESHLERLKVGACDLKCATIFTDMINDLERSGDHANNIAFYIAP